MFLYNDDKPSFLVSTLVTELVIILTDVNSSILKNILVHSGTTSSKEIIALKGNDFFE